MIQLTHLSTDVDTGVIAKYDVGFATNPHTHVTAAVQLYARGDKVTATIDFGACVATTQDLALDKLADWMERAALILKQRKTRDAIPVFH